MKYTPEQRERMRLHAIKLLADKTLKPEARRWAKHWAAIPPLNRPLTTGESN